MTVIHLLSVLLTCALLLQPAHSISGGEPQFLQKSENKAVVQIVRPFNPPEPPEFHTGNLIHRSYIMTSPKVFQ